MITRLEMVYRSELPCKKKPALFSTGSYTVKVEGREFTFDFEEMTACTEIKDGYLYVDVMQKNLDDSFFTSIEPSEMDRLLRKVRKEDFTEIFYECYESPEEIGSISLVPVEMTFYDFSSTGDVDSAEIEVEGENFSNLEIDEQVKQDKDEKVNNLENNYALISKDSISPTYYYCHGPFHGKELAVKQTDLKYARRFPTREAAKTFNDDLPDWLRDRFSVKEISGWDRLVCGIPPIQTEEVFLMDSGPLGLIFCFD